MDSSKVPARRPAKTVRPRPAPRAPTRDGVGSLPPREAAGREAVILRTAMQAFIGVAAGLQVAILLLLYAAALGSHTALILAWLLSTLALVGLACGWPALQLQLLHWNLKLMLWGFARGAQVLARANLIVVAVAAVSAFILIVCWPAVIARVAADLGETKILELSTRSQGTIATSTYTLPPDGALAVALPPGLLRVHLSGFPAGTLRYGVWRNDEWFAAMIGRPIWVMPEYRARLHLAGAWESVTAALSSFGLGTTRVDHWVCSKPFPRDLALCAEPATTGLVIQPLRGLAELRNNLLYGQPQPFAQALEITAEVEAYTPSAWRGLVLAIPAVVVGIALGCGIPLKALSPSFPINQANPRRDAP